MKTRLQLKQLPARRSNLYTSSCICVGFCRVGCDYYLVLYILTTDRQTDSHTITHTIYQTGNSSLSHVSCAPVKRLGEVLPARSVQKITANTYLPAIILALAFGTSTHSDNDGSLKRASACKNDQLRRSNESTSIHSLPLLAPFQWQLDVTCTSRALDEHRLLLR